MNLRGMWALILSAALALIGSTTDSLALGRQYRAHHHHTHHYENHQGKHRNKIKAVASIAAPIAIGAAFGPAGSVGYQVVKHRKTIRRHLFHRG